jgi:hypothetical protein
MSAAWVAGSIRAAAMARRRLGTAQVRLLADSRRTTDAVDVLAQSPYGHDVRPDATLAEAERGIASALLWNMRVLAGWLPAEGGEMLRVLAGGFEIANVDDRMASEIEQGTKAPAPFRLGSLATAWPRLARASSLAQLRATLGASPWGDPGDDTSHAISLCLRLAWTYRVATAVPPARPWAAGAAALMVARERFVASGALPRAAGDAAARVLGSATVAASSLDDFVTRLPPEARWALADTARADELWRDEARWWSRVQHDGHALLADASFGPKRPLGAVAMLAADAWQTQAALEICARGGLGREVLDAAA